MELQGHKRRVAYIEWHPVAENVLFSAGFDHLVIVWDINKGEAVNVIDRHPDVIYSISLNRDGSLLATTCKDKKLRVFEPRSGIVVSVCTISLKLFHSKLRVILLIINRKEFATLEQRLAKSFSLAVLDVFLRQVLVGTLTDSMPFGASMI